MGHVLYSVYLAHTLSKVMRDWDIGVRGYLGLEKVLKKKVLGAILVLMGFTVMAIYPYLMYMMGDETSYAVVKATLTTFVVLLGMIMAALGGFLAKGARGAEDTS